MTVSHSLFFYGTLIYPAVLRRVIGNQTSQLQVCPAVLLGYTSHQVKDEDYPALIKCDEQSSKLLFGGRKLTKEEAYVQGTVVTGLTIADVDLLDLFEGEEYARKLVAVHPLGPYTDIESDDAPPIFSSLPNRFLPPITVFTYVWALPLDRVSPQTWSHHPARDDTPRWLGTQYAEWYTEVDKRQAPTKNIAKSPEVPKQFVVPAFGHPMLKYFLFDPKYINLNNGSFGSLPRPVLEAAHAMTLECEANPDRFLRITYLPLLQEVRRRIASFINADMDEVVIVHNATHAINTILRNFEWNQGDILVGFTTTYGAILRTMQYMADRPPHPTLSIINLIFPTTHKAILDSFRSHLRSLPRHPGQKVLAMIDGMISNPGALMKWEEMVNICKEENVWSLVDAAHCIGQVDTNLEKVQPDFWVSNAHKWLYAKRGAAILYVPKRNQYIIRSSMPTSAFYVSPSDPNAPNFVAQFDWTGTQDFIPFLSISSALDFREAIGGEEKINNYCHDLVIKGTRRMAEILGTRVMDETGEFTVNMADVLMPLTLPPSLSHTESVKLHVEMEHRLLNEWNCHVALYPHDGKSWLRCSAQVFNELSDFERVAEGLLKICQDMSIKLASKSISLL